MNDREFYRQLLAVVEEGREAYMVTVIAAVGSTPQKIGARMLVFPEGNAYGTIGGGGVERQLLEMIVQARPAAPGVVRVELRETGEGPGMLCGGAMEFFIEPLGKASDLTIIGGGHCAVELSALAARTGFAVTVLDPRAEWASREKHPAARVVCAPVGELEQHIRFGPNAFIVIMTHGHEHDELALRLCLPHEARYLGMIGSANKARRVRENLLVAGHAPELLAKVHTPIGLQIGSHTPAEIAVSIMAELISVRNGAVQ